MPYREKWVYEDTQKERRTNVVEKVRTAENIVVFFSRKHETALYEAEDSRDDRGR